MKTKQVAVIDVGSSKITAAVCERGINKTFVIKGMRSYNYEGFSNGEFFDINAVKEILLGASDFIKTVAGEEQNTVYVGVPGEFTRIYVRDSQISFAKKKKITAKDVDALFDSAFLMQGQGVTAINRSAIVYELGDYRRLANPIGATSEILRGKLSFAVCDNGFIELFKSSLKAGGFANVECVSSSLAEAMYVIDAETRDRIALLLDVGYITSTLTLVQGDGILYQKSFGYGGGYVTASISEKYDIDFSVAENLKRKINLSRKTDGLEKIENTDGKYYLEEDVKAVIMASLDELCENISQAIDESNYVIPEYVPLLITGGGISYIRGAKEHVSDRLSSAVEIVAPKVPLMNKPDQSSLLSLLDLALEQI